MRKDKLLEVPSIVWGLNNQKIAFAKAYLTIIIVALATKTSMQTILVPKHKNKIIHIKVHKILMWFSQHSTNE